MRMTLSTEMSEHSTRRGKRRVPLAKVASQRDLLETVIDESGDVEGGSSPRHFLVQLTGRRNGGNENGAIHGDRHKMGFYSQPVSFVLFRLSLEWPFLVAAPPCSNRHCFFILVARMCTYSGTLERESGLDLGV
jgi:hypothetical protein